MLDALTTYTKCINSNRAH